MSFFFIKLCNRVFQQAGAIRRDTISFCQMDQFCISRCHLPIWEKE